METRKAKTTVVVVLSAMVVLLVLCLPAAAGNLEPSAAPAPTMKTLDEVEPRIPVQSLSGSISAVYVISQPGSYYLTGDVNVVSTTKYGIYVDVNDVTIDLMGYQLIGPDSGTKTGIYIYGRTNVEIRNGTVRDFGSCGIYEAYHTKGRGHRVINVRVVSNGSYGIYFYGSSHLVKDCTAGENASTGIYAGGSSTVTGNTVYDNGSHGIGTGSGSTVTGNTAYDNSSTGIVASGGSTVTGNTAYNNDGDGIYAGSSSTVTGNTARNNGTYGIIAHSGSTVTGNTAYGNQYNGIYLGGNCLVDQNTAYLNNQSGGSYTNISACGSCTFGINHNPAP